MMVCDSWEFICMDERDARDGVRTGHCCTGVTFKFREIERHLWAPQGLLYRRTLQCRGWCRHHCW